MTRFHASMVSPWAALQHCPKESANLLLVLSISTTVTRLCKVSGNTRGNGMLFAGACTHRTWTVLPFVVQEGHDRPVEHLRILNKREVAGIGQDQHARMRNRACDVFRVG